MPNAETIALVKRFEGCKLKPYYCAAGYPTLGYGRVIRSIDHPSISQAMAEDWLMQDLMRFENGVKKIVKVQLNDNQLGALTSFAFNLGLGNLKASTLLRLVNRGDFQSAAEQFEKWNKAAGVVLKGLTKRRLAERALFLQ